MKVIFEPFRTFWEHGTDFKGTTSRLNFWLAIWLNLIVYLCIFGYIFAYKRKYGAIFGIFVLVIYTMLVIMPFLAVQTRRYHDVGLHGWWLWLTIGAPLVLVGIQHVELPAMTLLTWSAVVLGLIHLVILLMPQNSK